MRLSICPLLIVVAAPMVAHESIPAQAQQVYGGVEQCTITISGLGVCELIPPRQLPAVPRRRAASRKAIVSAMPRQAPRLPNPLSTAQ